MAPNLIGNTFMLAESAIEPETAKRTTVVTSLPQTPAASVIRPTPSAPITKKSLEVEVTTSSTKEEEYKLEIVWRNVIAFSLLHLAALYSVYLIINRFYVLEYLWGHFVGLFGGMGITAGAHRLWAHKSYKAKTPLRVFLMFCQTLAFQNSIHEWVRDHRAHHKFCDTDGDPHNSKRGFFFSHMGWLMCKKHPDVKTKGKMVDMSDLEADPVVMFQKKYYMFLMPLCCFVIPALVPYCFFNISFWDSVFVSSVLRYVISLHFTWLVNSAAHIWGMRSFDKTISPRENKVVAILANGEGWHNYHHVFPWDYKAAELGHYTYNLSTAFIDFFAKIGWAYDLKTVSKDMINKRVGRTGDGTYRDATLKNRSELVMELNEKHNHEQLETNVWGWDDKDMPEDDKKSADIRNKSD